MKEAREKLNKSAWAIEEAQNDIRDLMRAAYMRRYPRERVERELKAIIGRALQEITIERLKRDTAKSLTAYANSQRELWRKIEIAPAVLVYLAKRADELKNKASGAELKREPPPEIKREIERVFGVKIEKRGWVAEAVKTQNKGVPLGKFYGEVWKEQVKPTLEKITKERALDPSDLTGRNSLRNLAEMEVRYQDHKDEIAELKASGEKLVMCSAHADCSKRCAPYQGRLYSLDGTRGEKDGIKYVPLEEATENPADRYTTKAGRVYQNGLFGFNCRHRLTPYRGQSPEYISEDERRKEYAITKQQRAMEREIRDIKANAGMSEAIGKKRESIRLKKVAANLYDEYKKYSHENGRAYYPMRVKI